MPPLDLLKAKANVRHPYAQVDAHGRVELSPSLVIKYASENGIPDVKDPVKHIRDILEADPELIRSLFTPDVRKWPIHADNEMRTRIRRAKKCSARASPCFSATDYCRVKMRGNDGQMYVSTVTTGYATSKEEMDAFMSGTWKKNRCVWRVISRK